MIVERWILGHLVRFETNAAAVASIAAELFDPVPFPPGAVSGTDELLSVRISVEDRPENRADHRDDLREATIRHHSAEQGRLVVVVAGSSVGMCDPPRRESRAAVTPELVRRAAFRIEVLEALTMALVSHFDRHPLHAAAVRGNGRTLLLVGPSGAGKSTLAYAAHRAGLETLAEDRVWIQQSPAFHIWHHLTPARLRADALAHFPELARRLIPSTVDGTGKCLVALNARSDVRGQEDSFGEGKNSVAGHRDATDVRVVLLARATTSAYVERLPAAAVAQALLSDVAPGFDRFPDRHGQVAHTLAAPGGWRLHLSHDPHDAVPLLRDLLYAKI